MINEFPLIIEDFSPGFQTKRDASRLKVGTARAGQNVEITDGDRIAPRKGRELFGVADASAAPIISTYTFRLKDGTEVPLRSASTVLEYYNTVAGEWANLHSNYTNSQPFGFKEFNENDEYQDQCVICNGIETFSTWNGAHDALDGALAGSETEIVVDTVLRSTIHYSATASATSTTTVSITASAWATDLWNDDFYVHITSGAASGKISRITATTATQITFAAISSLSGTPTFEIRQAKFNHSGTLRIGTTNVLYSSLDQENRFAGCSGTPAALDGASVGQAMVDFEGNPRGNIIEALNGKLCIAGYNSSTIYVSAVFDATDFTFSSPRVAGEGDIVDFVEGGGKITGMGIQEDTVYVLKRDVIKTLTYSQDTDDIVQTSPVIASPYVGPENFQSVFKVDNQLFFASSKGGIKAASRVENYDFVQSLQISDPIRPTVNDSVWDEAAGIFFDGKAYIATKMDSDSTYNDIIYVYNFEKETWDLPIIGWPINTFFIFNGDLYGGSSLNKETYKLLSTYSDASGSQETTYQSAWVSSYMNFDEEAKTKSFTSFYVEGYISETTTLTITLNFDYNGVTSSLSGTISGTDTEYLLLGEEDSPFGTAIFGTNPFGTGSSELDTETLSKFRVYFTCPHIPFYEYSATFSSEGVGQQWEVLRFGPNAVELGEIKVKLKKQMSS